MSQLGFPLHARDLSAAELFAKRLTEHRHPIVGTSVTDLRAAILAAACDLTIFGRAPNRKPETYAQAFERHFGEPLVPKTKGKSR